ncbi:MAG TPA: hypothetical protein DCG62_02630 [Acinetobacter johnsonii]|nr:hypothetical protein [Acinetobacter johnsonii]
MNLIEQLGGYEAAKAEGEKWGFDDFLNNQLLEYRRQHNIFEVGDKVKAKDHQFGFDELFRIDDFFANDDGVNLAVLDDGDCYPISFLEHATDAEIKAGKRLEVK